MTAPLPPTPETPPDRVAGARDADVCELLDHVITSWDAQRRLLARQLHDSLGSSMTALSMHLTLLTQHVPADTALQERGAQMQQLLGTVINVNRELQLALWNDKLEFLGIEAAIESLVREFGDTHPVQVDISLPEHDSAYPRPIGVALLRCVEEGLRNIAAHAQASAVAVILDDDGAQIMLTVRDNGVGIDAACAFASCRCHGLRTLRERAAYLGGRLSVGAAPDAQPGTMLTLILPSPAGANGTLDA